MDISAVKIFEHAQSMYSTGHKGPLYVVLNRDDIYSGYLQFTVEEVNALDAAEIRFAIEDRPRGTFAVTSTRPGKKSYGAENFRAKAVAE